MKRCLITYEGFEGEGDYSPRGLKLLDRRLGSLAPLEYSAEEQHQQAIDRAGQMSIQGVHALDLALGAGLVAGRPPTDSAQAGRKTEEQPSASQTVVGPPRKAKKAAVATSTPRKRVLARSQQAS